jgi:hypothetical protein
MNFINTLIAIDAAGRGKLPCRLSRIEKADIAAQMVKPGKRRAHLNLWGNWIGYSGASRVEDFGTDEHDALHWLITGEQFREGSEYNGLIDSNDPRFTRRHYRRGLLVELRK